MLITNRVVPVLTLQDGLLVKTRGFKKPVYVGDPVNAVKIFNEKEVDELVLLDMDPPRKGSSPNLALIEEIATEAFMPLAYGGGIDSVDTARRVVGCGVEKVVVTSAWHSTPRLVPELAAVLGSQAVVAGVDYRRTRRATEVYVAGGRTRTRRTVEEVCESLVAQGAGEVLLQSIDRDGTMAGMDVELVRSLSAELPVPVIAVGGAGSAADLGEVLRAGASAVGASSMFVFHGKHRAVLITYPARATVEELSRL